MSTLLDLISEKKTRKTHGRKVSEETIYSIQTNSFQDQQRSTHNYIHHRTARANDSMGFKSTGSTYVAQRVLSAKVLRVKELQNELQTTKTQLHELLSENKLLRNLQKRQDTALARYEDTSAALPRLLENHRSEVNTLKAHASEVRGAARSLHRKLLRSEGEVATLREQYNKLKSVAEDKDLEGRARLQKKIEDLEDRLTEMRDKNIGMCRKLEIEQKSHSQQLAAEISKRKNVSKELQAAYNEISRLNAVLHGGAVNGEGDNGLHSNSTVSLVPLASIPSTSRTKYSVKNSVLNPNNNKLAKLPSPKVNLPTPKNAKIAELKQALTKMENDEDDLEENQLGKSMESLIEPTRDDSLANSLITGMDLTETSFLKSKSPPGGNTSFRHIESYREVEKHKWYDEVTTDKATDYSTSRTSCEITASKSSIQSSERPETNISSVDSYSAPKTLEHTEHESDSSDEKNQTLKIKIKKERYRQTHITSDSSSSNKDGEKEVEVTESSSTLESMDKRNSQIRTHPSRYTKTTKNNLTKVQDHLSQIDDDLSMFMHDKAHRDQEGDQTESRDFDNYVNKLEHLDRFSENLKTESTPIRTQTIERLTIIKNQSDSEEDDEELYQSKHQANYQMEDTLHTTPRRRRDSNHTGINFDIDDKDKYLAEIDNSYKLIRTRMDAENALMNEKLKNFCNEVTLDVEKTNDAIDRQKQNLEINKRETELIEKSVRRNSKLNQQLKSNGRIDSNKKNQLLAALKAIDTGKSFDDFSKASTVDNQSVNSSRVTTRRRDKSQIMKELFDT